MRTALLDGAPAPAPAPTGSRRAEASRRSIQAPSVLQINQEAAVELLDKWRARGIHTPCKKQAVWEIMASRALKSDDIAEAGYPGVEVMSRIERTTDPRARRPSQVGTPMARLAKTSKWEGETIAPGGRIYARVYSWTSPANRLTEGIILLLIMANVISVVVDAVITPPDQPQTRFFRDLERFSTVIFTIEYLLRIGSCTAHPQFAGKAGSWCPWLTGRLSFMLKPLSALDLVALVPFYLDIWLESGFSMGGSREKHFRGGARSPCPAPAAVPPGTGICAPTAELSMARPHAQAWCCGGCGCCASSRCCGWSGSWQRWRSLSRSSRAAPASSSSAPPHDHHHHTPPLATPCARDSLRRRQWAGDVLRAADAGADRRDPRVLLRGGRCPLDYQLLGPGPSATPTHNKIGALTSLRKLPGNC